VSGTAAPGPQEHPVDPDLVQSVADAVLAAPVVGADALAGGRRVVAVDGRSGSGKTSLATALHGVLARRTGVRVALVHVDDLYPGWDGLAAAVPRLVDGVLRPIAAGAPTGRLRRWDWALGRDGDVEEVALGRWTVVEGVGAGAVACRPYLSLLVWVDAPDDVRRARALRRDGDTYAPHWQRWAAQEAAYLERDDPRGSADLVVRLDGKPE
jgi:energy-coupling factor transporter ATP-binding protein EcfA2